MITTVTTAPPPRMTNHHNLDEAAPDRFDGAAARDDALVILCLLMMADVDWLGALGHPIEGLVPRGRARIIIPDCAAFASEWSKTSGLPLIKTRIAPNNTAPSNEGAALATDRLTGVRLTNG